MSLALASVCFIPKADTKKPFKTEARFGFLNSLSQLWVLRTRNYFDENFYALEKEPDIR